MACHCDWNRAAAPATAPDPRPSSRCASQAFSRPSTDINLHCLLQARRTVAPTGLTDPKFVEADCFSV